MDSSKAGAVARAWIDRVQSSSTLRRAVEDAGLRDFALRLDAIRACEINPMLDADIWVNLGDETFMSLDLREEVSKQIFAFKAYEHDLSLYLLNALGEGDVFLDIGAHFGYFSILASKAVGASGQVHAFEPVPYTFDRLMRNVSALPNVTGWNLAAWSRTEFRAISFLGRGQPAFSTFYSPRLPDEELQGTIEKVSVHCVTLDSFCEEKGVAPTLIKIDAEDAERDVIAGMEWVMREYSPTITVEVGDTYGADASGSRATLEALMAHGYDIFSLESGVVQPHVLHPSGAYLYGNMVAIKPRRKPKAPRGQAASAAPRR